MLAAFTMNYAEEAAGIALAARDATGAGGLTAALKLKPELPNHC